MTTHNNVVSFDKWVKRAGYSPARAVLGMASPSFDAASFEIWSPLLGGAKCVLTEEALPAPRRLAELIAEHGIDTMFMTPGFFNGLIDEAADTLASLRVLLVGGEALSIEHVTRAISVLPGVLIVNVYGPTECTVYSSHQVIRKTLVENSSTVPIGSPVEHATFYLLDGAGGLVPVGVPGELHVGGSGVARGYLGGPGLTAERFVPDPFGAAGGRLYRTGDLARWRQDGTLEFIGRADRQVKIRGFRIEPGEIEAVLRQQPEIAGAVVAGYAGAAGRRRLAAYVTWRAGQGRLDGPQLRARLGGLLPGYMIPSAFVPLEEIPLSANAKVDYSRLPDPGKGQAEPDGGYEPPAGPVERALAAVWQEVLGLNRVGRNDNFFDIGGDSISAVAVVTRARKADLNFTMRDIVAFQTVAQLSEQIKVTMKSVGADSIANNPGKEKSSRRALVEIRKASATNSIFCVHPSGGGIRAYERLSRWLPVEQSVYALQAVGIADGLEPSATVEEAAELYFRELIDVQSNGPYVLLSWSLGGVFAIELARLIERSGARVSSLILAEPSFPDMRAFNRLQGPLEVYRAADNIQQQLARADISDPVRRKLEHDFATLLSADCFSSDDRSLGLDLPMRTPRALLECFYRYRIRSYAGSIHLIATEDCLASSPERPTDIAGISFGSYAASWRSMASLVQVHQAEGKHISMFDARYSQNLARLVTGIIASDLKTGQSGES